MISVPTRYCEECNQYKYIEACGLCRDCNPIDKLTTIRATTKGVFKQGISDVHKFKQHIQKQYEIDSDSVSAVRREDYSEVFISPDCKVWNFKKDGLFVLNSTLPCGPSEKHIEEATEMYESYHKNIENNASISISTQPKILKALYSAELGSFNSKQLNAVGDKFVDSNFYSSDGITRLKHKGIIVFKNGNFKIPGPKTKEEARELALEVYRDIKNI
jgi:hypothetical protein